MGLKSNLTCILKNKKKVNRKGEIKEHIALEQWQQATKSNGSQWYIEKDTDGAPLISFTWKETEKISKNAVGVGGRAGPALENGLGG